MNKPKSLSFSIIIPTLNEEERLPKLLEDLANQTFSDFEVIIVDGKSGDQTTKKASEFKNKILRLSILTSKKRNVAYQRNLGSKKAASDWLIFIDADCRIPTYFLQGIKFHIESKNADIIAPFILPDTKNSKDKAIATIFNIYSDLQKKSKKPTILESTLIIKKSSFDKLKGFKEDLHWGEGGDILRRAIKKKMTYQVVKEPKYTYSFRRFRSQGTLKSIRSSALLELARLQDRKLTKDKLKKLYPMEGGKYFEIDRKISYRLKKFFSSIFTGKNNQEKFKKVLKKIFENGD